MKYQASNKKLKAAMESIKYSMAIDSKVVISNLSRGDLVELVCLVGMLLRLQDTWQGYELSNGSKLIVMQDTEPMPQF